MLSVECWILVDWFYDAYDDGFWVMMGLGAYEVLDSTHTAATDADKRLWGPSYSVLFFFCLEFTRHKNSAQYRSMEMEMDNLDSLILTVCSKTMQTQPQVRNVR